MHTCAILAELGLVRTVEPAADNPSGLAQKIRECLESNVPVHSLLPMNGAEQATLLLKGITEDDTVASEHAVFDERRQVSLAE